jgi:hypothetical protein
MNLSRESNKQLQVAGAMLLACAAAALVLGGVHAVGGVGGAGLGVGLALVAAAACGAIGLLMTGLGAARRNVLHLTRRVDSIAKARQRLQRRLHRTRREADEAGARLTETRTELDRVRRHVKALGRRVKKLESPIRPANPVRFQRDVSKADYDSLASEWAPRLGVEVTRQHLVYLQRKLTLIEQGCDGRAAASATDMLLRVLVGRAAPGPELDVLEIGVLFGVNASFFHVATRPFFDAVRMHLLDPLEGYYGRGHRDPLVDLPVTGGIVERNLSMWGVGPDEWRGLQGYSTDPAILAAAGDRVYDMLLIDADHTYDGVRQDFELYGPLVKRGGYVLFDDYANPDWPDVQRYVDAVVRLDDRFEFIGHGWRTAVFRRRAGEASA